MKHNFTTTFPHNDHLELKLYVKKTSKVIFSGVYECNPNISFKT